MNTKTRTILRALLAIGGTGALAAGLSPFPRHASAGTGEAVPSITLNGIVRDFRERSVANGHPDFEANPTEGFGHCMGNVSDTLDADGKPVFTGAGHLCTKQATDKDGHPINPRFYDAARGDQPATMGAASGAGIKSADSFAQWFRTVPGVNMAAALPITLTLDPSTGHYVFDDRLDDHFASLGGFFPVNERLFGNSAGDDRNFHFTYELSTEFTYHKGTGQVFTFRGDDDVFVYIGGKLVIDIGGIHSAVEQTVDLDRLDWLTDAENYPLNFFFAERHRTQSNFRIETTLKLRTCRLPNSTHLWD